MQLIGIQYLRFISAMLVVVMHATEAIALRLPSSGQQIWDRGSVGVDIFFVISGFVMTITCLPGGTYGSNPLKEAGNFFWRRIVRIAPIYWVYTLLKVALVLALPSLALRTSISAEHVLASLFFWPTVAPWGLIQPVLPVGWSLNFEMLFYCLFAIAIATRLPRALFCLCVFALFLAGRHLVPDSAALQFYSQGIIFEFLYGIVIGNLFRKNICLPPQAAVAGVFVAVFAIFFTDVIQDVDRAISWGLPAALIVWATVSLEAYARRFSPARINLAFWGDASYSIYLSHSFAVPAFVVACVKAQVADAILIATLTCLASAAVGGLSYLCLEQPLSRILRRTKA